MSENYQITVNRPWNLSKAEKEKCTEIIQSGGATSGADIPKNLSRALHIAIVRHDEKIIGCGVIKTIRAQYISRIKERSGFALPDIPELGYIAIAPEYRRKHIADAITSKLTDTYSEKMFSVASCQTMDNILFRNSFFRYKVWAGNNGNKLTLWIKG